MLCKAELPMDVEFMVSDTLEVCVPMSMFWFVFTKSLALQMLRPKMTPFKTFQEAAVAIDEMVAAQSVEGKTSSLMSLGQG